MENVKYVSEETFRSEIRRIDQKVDNTVDRIELKMDAFTARLEGKFDRLEAKVNGRVDTIEAKVDSLTTFVGWVIGLTALIVAVSAIVIPLVK